MKKIEKTDVTMISYVALKLLFLLEYDFGYERFYSNIKL